MLTLTSHPFLLPLSNSLPIHADLRNVDKYKNPHQYTKTAISRATGENQYALGRVLGLEVSPPSFTLNHVNWLTKPSPSADNCKTDYPTHSPTSRYPSGATTQSGSTKTRVRARSRSWRMGRGWGRKMGRRRGLRRDLEKGKPGKGNEME